MSKKKSNHKRNYRAEYQRRIERGAAKGLSRSQARGHPKAKEKNAGKPRPINDAAFQISLQALRSGKTLAEAAKEIRVSSERLRNQANARGIIRKQGKQWVVRKNLPRQILIYSESRAILLIVGTFAQASKAGRYMAAVGRFLRNNDADHLKPFIGKTITNKAGKTYVFETDPNALYRLAVSGTASFQEIYRIII